MADPVILVVDDEPAVLRAVERELRGQYGADYTVVAADSGEAALDVIRRLALRETPVALLLVDQRMPRMTGIELLAASLELVPDAKRVLLTAYADTDVAIRAINEIRLDQYLQKPWDPPEERLYPVLDDLLADWRAAFRPAVRGDPPGRPPLVGAGPRDQGLPLPEPGPVPLGRRGDRPGGDRASRQAPGVGPGRDPLLVFPDGSHLAGARRTPRSPRRSGCGRDPASGLRPRDRRRRAGGAGGGRLRRVGGAADAAWSRARRRAGRRARPRGSRTTSVPVGAVRRGPDPSRRRPGEPPRRGGADPARGDRASASRTVTGW